MTINCNFNLVLWHSSQRVPLRESRKRSRDGSQQKHSRAIMALSFFNSQGFKMPLVTSTTIIFQLNRIFNLKNNNSVPVYITWKSINESFWIGQHVYDLGDLPGKRIFEVYQKFFFSVSNKKVDGGEAVQKKR